MTISLVLVVVMAALVACGVFLLLERSLTRVVLGFLLIGNGVNLLILIMTGRPGIAPIVVDGVAADDYTDPLPQALILTAIVITFAVSAFLLALIYRSWRLANADDVSDDVDDVALREGAITLPLEETTPDEGDTDFPADEGALTGFEVDDSREEPR
ncbi:MAG: Na(+)/H(+) antiporter subunit C [Microcella sp.]|uniref:Na(+)/H(+) antiporter subunit C n=1 Tax=Microcella sp. TaxID=1913979 RepID=UPI0024CB7334|nr:Na(+)/H(+) antiporter subunit C [Microcella sp.]UYN82499.1 MAG: Na(+)/H(+) antiporter subunit C [Microcella sp.]